MVQHVDIVDPNIHEPRGVLSAAISSVYIANGAGSGAWSLPPGTLSKVVYVNSLSDFPVPISNVITLVTGFTYIISGNVDVGNNTINHTASTGIVGHNRNTDGLTYTGTGDMFTSSQFFIMSELNFTAVNGSVLNLVGTGGETAVITNCFVVECATFGTINTYGVIAFRSFSCVKATVAGLSLIGSNSEFSLTNSFWIDTVGTFVDLGTATFDRVNILAGNRFITVGGQTAISGMANSGNINAGGSGKIINSAFQGAGTALNNILPTDSRWLLEGSSGIPRTLFSAQGNIISSGLATTFSGIGFGNVELVNFGTAFIMSEENQFTVSDTGRFTYDGEVETEFYVDVTFYSTIGGGASRVYVYSIFKNGTLVASSEAKANYDGSNPDSGSCSSTIKLDSTDFFELYVYAETATTALNVDTCSIKVIGT